MTVAACPDVDRLVRFLNGPLPDTDDESVAGHVEDCAACRAKLERLATATELPALRAARNRCPDGSRLVSGSVYPDTAVRLWDAATGRPIADMRGHTNTIRWLAFSPDGRRIVTASLDETARLWDGVTG